MLFGSGPKSFRRNGTWDREKAYYKAFKENNFQPTLIEYPINRKKYKGFIKILIIFIKLFNSIIDPITYQNKYKDFELIRCKQIYGSWSGLLLKISSKKKLIIRVGYSWSQSILYETDIKSIKYLISRKLENLIINNSDGIIVSSKYLKEKYNFINKNIVIIPNGVDSKIFKNNYENRIYDYIYVGRLIKIKGVDRLIDFIKKNSSKSFLIIGANPNKIDLSKYKNVTYKINLNNNKISNYMNRAKIILNLSRSEGSPKAVIEGIACGCFPILSNIEAHQNIIEDLNYGEIINYPNKSMIKIGEYNEYYYKKFHNKYSLNNCVRNECDFMRDIFES